MTFPSVVLRSALYRFTVHRTSEDNADAHLKRRIKRREVVVAITGGCLDFGPWEQISFGDFDRVRSKRVLAVDAFLHASRA